MMKTRSGSTIGRRSVLAGMAGLAAPFVLRFPAQAAEFNLKLGHDDPVDHPMNIRAVEAADRITRETNGRISMKVFPNNQLGNDTQMLSQLRSGALEFMLLGDGILANVVPMANLTGLPFAFSGYDDLWKTMDSPFGDTVRAQIEKAGIHPFSKGWDAGFRHVFTSTVPVKTADDLKGVKLRVPEAPIQLATFRALGASPTPVNNSELYTALQTHLVDGAEVPLLNIQLARYYETTKYISLTYHQPTPWEMLASGITWRRLPKDLKDIVSGIFDETAIKQRADIAAAENQLKTKLATEGQTIIDPDIASFKTKIRAAGLYGQWQDAYGAECFALLEKMVGKLT